MTKVIQKDCKNDHHESDFIYYCLHRDCDQSNRYICKNCIKYRSHSHHNHCRDVIEIYKLEQQLRFDTKWIYDNFDQIQNIIHELEELQNLINIDRKFVLLFRTQKLINKLLNLNQDIFQKSINLVKLDETSLNLLIQEIYFNQEYREACNLLRYFRRVYRFYQIYKCCKAFQMMQQIKERLSYVGSRKFDQNQYNYIEVEKSQFRYDCVYISQNEESLAYTFNQQLYLVSIQNMNKKQCYFQSPIIFIEFTDYINFLFVKSTSSLKLFNVATFKSKFSIYTDGYRIYDDKYSFLVSSYRKIQYYNKQSRKLIWKSDTINDGISYEKKNQLIVILEKYVNISIINVITKHKILLQKTFKTYSVQQIILRDKNLYISARIPDLKFLKFKINTEQKSTNLISSYKFSPQFYFSVDKNQNIILFDDKNISIYSKYFILDHQINQQKIKIDSKQKLIEISQSSKNLIIFSERKKNICYYLRQRNK